MLPGFGTRHPALAPCLADRTPLSSEQAQWPSFSLQISAYAGAAELPDPLVSSVRCLVTVGGLLVVTRTAHGDVSILPGGRREPGESFCDTAVREVREETGCDVDVSSVEMVGFLHFEHLTPAPEGHPFPHPDFLQVVLRGRADAAPEGWVDTEGFVLQSWLVPPAQTAALELAAHERALLPLALAPG